MIISVANAKLTVLLSYDDEDVYRFRIWHNKHRLARSFPLINLPNYVRLQDGSRGHLEGLASVYCEMLMAPFADVIEVLEVERQHAWTESSPHRNGMRRGHRGSPGKGLPNSHSQPIYVPGKYSPSSCLSDKEEDEIYGFGYGVFAQQVNRRPMHSANNSPQHQLPMGGGGGGQSHQPQLVHPQPQLYANCFSGFDQQQQLHHQQTLADRKKKTTLGRLLKGFKTVRRKDKESLKHTLPDRLRQQFHMNGGGAATAHLSFEETIQRLKIEEAMRKREKYQREHEEVGGNWRKLRGYGTKYYYSLSQILRDIQRGLQQMSRGDQSGKGFCDENDSRYHSH